MDSLTCGERYIRCLTGGSIDRVPFGVGLGFWPWGETMENWRRQSGLPQLDIVKQLQYEPAVAIPAFDMWLKPAFEPKVISQDEEFVIHRDANGITKRDRRDFSCMPEFLDYPVKTPADWQALKAERFRLGDPSRVRQDWNAFRDHIRRTGEAVQVGWPPMGVFGSVRDLMGAEEILLAFITEPEMVRDMMTHLTSLWLEVWGRVGDEVQIDHIHIWEDMSGRQGSLISPAMVEEFMMPCYDRIAAFARDRGVRMISVDTDGDCSELVPLMMKHGVNMFFPFEVQAGNDILDYRRKYPTLGIVGGLDKRALAGTKADVDRELAKAAEMLKYGRYIPGWDHCVPPDSLWPNFEYAARELRALCHASRNP